ncbi:MAG: transglutaminase domain-containing protein, partial [Oscillospiraceae bacterium]
EKKLYGNIVDAATEFKSSVAVPDGMTVTQITKTYINVKNQEPQLFWLPRTMPGVSNNVMTINYAYTKKEAAEIQAEIDKNVKTILNKANQYKSTSSKIKVMYDWVCQNSSAAVSSGEEISSIVNGLTKGGELQCSGYAKSMQYLFDIAGIPSVVVVGKTPAGDSHAWNKVYCDNGYYNIDATWGDPIIKRDESYVRYNFFLVPDSWIKNDHLDPNIFYLSNGTGIKLFDEPACTKTSANYYKANKKEFTTYKEAMAGMKAEIDASIKAGLSYTGIRVTTKEVWDKMNTTDSFRELQNYAKSKSSKVQKLSKITNWNDGVLVIQYDVIYK